MPLRGSLKLQKALKNRIFTIRKSCAMCNVRHSDKYSGIDVEGEEFGFDV